VCACDERERKRERKTERYRRCGNTDVLDMGFTSTRRRQGWRRRALLSRQPKEQRDKEREREREREREERRERERERKRLIDRDRDR
jgi:hypothetical protein